MLPEVPKDTRSSVEETEIGELKEKKGQKGALREFDAGKRELQRLAGDSAEYYFRDKQVEANDALIDDRVLQSICARTSRMDYMKMRVG